MLAELSSWNLWLLTCIQINVNDMTPTHLRLLDEYRIALGLWSDVRALYAPQDPEVAAATTHLEALERQLASLNAPALMA